jgi:hypothetical protein
MAARVSRAAAPLSACRLALEGAGHVIGGTRVRAGPGGHGRGCACTGKDADPGDGCDQAGPSAEKGGNEALLTTLGDFVRRVG